VFAITGKELLSQEKSKKLRLLLSGVQTARHPEGGKRWVGRRTEIQRSYPAGPMWRRTAKKRSKGKESVFSGRAASSSRDEILRGEGEGVRKGKAEANEQPSLLTKA